MLKIAKAQTREHKKLAALFLQHWEEGASRASLELLIKHSFQRYPLIPGHLSCELRGTRFHLDRRAALLDWLMSVSESNVASFHVSVVEWGHGFLYSYMAIPGSVCVMRIEDMLSDLSWYHTSACVPEPGKHKKNKCSKVAAGKSSHL